MAVRFFSNNLAHDLKPVFETMQLDLNKPVTTVFRVDYPRMEDRVESELIGLFIAFGDKAENQGIRMSANSEFGVDYSVETYPEFEEFVQGIYGAANAADKQTGLDSLRGKRLFAAYHGIESSKPVASSDFILLGKRVAAQLLFDDESVLTFWNSADEGEYSFAFACCPNPFEPFIEIDWRAVTC